MTTEEMITVVTTTSPIPSHPSTRIIDTTFLSVRQHLPNARYLVLFDGIREEQQHLRKSYEEYRETLVKRIDSGEWGNAAYLVFPEFTHQGGMIREALRRERIGTPLILWVEHDFPFNGLPIDWPAIVLSLSEDEVCYLRFALPEENWLNTRAADYPMISRYGVPMMRIVNYSSLPHIARTDFFRRLVQAFKEGKIHLECMVTQEIPYHEEKWRLALYTPAGDLSRFYSLDGRSGPEKLPMVP